MKHLTSEELSAHLDGALSGGAAETAERHLTECQDCRDALATLAAQDAELRPTLSHDPGDAYFDELPSRVAARIQAQAMTEPRESFSLARLFQSPRSLAWVGTAAVLVVGAGVVLMTANQVEVPSLHDRDLMSRSEHGERAAAPQEAEPVADQAQKPAAPSSAHEQDATRRDKSAASTVPPARDEAKKAAPADDRRAAAQEGFAAPPPPVSGSRTAQQSKDGDVAPTSTPAGADAKRQSTASPAAPPAAAAQKSQAKGGRANEVTLNQAGEPVPAPARTSPPPPSQTAGKEKQDDLRKQTAATPLEENRSREESAKLGTTKNEPGAKALTPPAPAAQSLAPPTTAGTGTLDAAGERTVRLCGDVRDSEDRPIAGAIVEISLLRIGTTTDLRGGFCLDAPAGQHRVTIMSVGFSSTTQTLRAGSGERAKITLSTVPVLVKPLEPVRPMPAKPTAPTPPAAPKADPYATVSESQRSVVRAAEQAQAKAGAQSDPKAAARLYDDAANGYQKVLKALMGQPPELETRWRLAEARFQAWQQDPNSRRESAAVEALTAYAGRAPGGPERERATRMLDRIKR